MTDEQDNLDHEARRQFDNEGKRIHYADCTLDRAVMKSPDGSTIKDAENAITTCRKQLRATTSETKRKELTVKLQDAEAYLVKYFL